MRIASYVQDSIVDGPGLRFTLFVQGCPHGCPGCHNPTTHDFHGGRELAVADVISVMLSNPWTDGLTLSGGEPFAQPSACAEIARAAKQHGLSVWAYTGYTFEQLLADRRPEIALLLSQCDVLVDGPFLLERRSLSLRWRGSTNQRVLDVPASLSTGRAVPLAGYESPGADQR